MQGLQIQGRIRRCIPTLGAFYLVQVPEAQSPILEEDFPRLIAPTQGAWVSPPGTLTSNILWELGKREQPRGMECKGDPVLNFGPNIREMVVPEVIFQ